MRRHGNEGGKIFGWKEKWKGWLKPIAVNGTRRTGIGVGVHGNVDIGEDASGAYVRLGADGTGPRPTGRLLLTNHSHPDIYSPFTVNILLRVSE